MNDEVIHIKQRLAALETADWQPEIIRRHGFQFRLVKVAGDFGWHTHEYSDKVLLAIEGAIAVDFADGRSLHLNAGDMAVVPKNVSHRPHSEHGALIVLIELPEPDGAA